MELITNKPNSPDSLFSSSQLESDSTKDLNEESKELSTYQLSCSKPAHLFYTHLSILPYKPIPGFYYLPNLIDHETEQEIMSQISELNFFNHQLNNQMMFFSRLDQNHLEKNKHIFNNWPNFLIKLIQNLPNLINSVNTKNLDKINNLFFKNEKLNLPWQIIINLYKPGEGIEQHVDLIERFDEIILGISLGSNVTIQFESINQKISKKIQEKIYLEQRSGYIITRDARYHWTHGILPNQFDDLVLDHATNETRKILRTRTRISITIRRLKINADLLEKK